MTTTITCFDPDVYQNEFNDIINEKYSEIYFQFLSDQIKILKYSEKVLSAFLQKYIIKVSQNKIPSDSQLAYFDSIIKEIIVQKYYSPQLIVQFLKGIHREKLFEAFKIVFKYCLHYGNLEYLRDVIQEYSKDEKAVSDALQEAVNTEINWLKENISKQNYKDLYFYLQKQVGGIDLPPLFLQQPATLEKQLAEMKIKCEMIVPDIRCQTYIEKMNEAIALDNTEYIYLLIKSYSPYYIEKFKIPQMNYIVNNSFDFVEASIQHDSLDAFKLFLDIIVRETRYFKLGDLTELVSNWIVKCLEFGRYEILSYFVNILKRHSVIVDCNDNQSFQKFWDRCNSIVKTTSDKMHIDRQFIIESISSYKPSNRVNDYVDITNLLENQKNIIFPNKFLKTPKE